MTRVGCVAYASDQGIAHIAKWMFDHGIFHEMMVFRHGSRRTHMEWYPPGTIELVGRPFSGPAVDEFLSRVDCVIFVESPFDWSFLDYCRKRGKKSAIIPMHECTPVRRPFEPDRWICPSLLDVQYFPGSEFIPVPVDPSTWRPRTKALRFLHNGGNLGLRGHKGTLELLQAVRHLKSPLSLTVRAQDTAGLRRLLEQCPWALKDERVTIEMGEVPYERLFEDHDVLVQPERYNGLSLPLQEGRAAGMLVMTTDRFPHNSWLPSDPLIPVASTHRARISGAYLEFEECDVDPQVIAATMDAWHGGDITGYSESGRRWAEENSWEALKPRWVKALSW